MWTVCVVYFNLWILQDKRNLVVCKFTFYKKKKKRKKMTGYVN